MSIPEETEQVNNEFLELTENIPEKQLSRYCGKWVYFNRKQGKAITFYCGRSKCPRDVCQHRFKAHIVKLISALIDEYALNRFLTLTMDRELVKAETWKVILGIWRNFKDTIKRIYPDFKFVWVLEAHKDGYPHIHAFINTYIPQADIVRHWVACGGGKIVWIEKIKVTGEMASYVSKQLGRYISKQSLCVAKDRVGKQHTFGRTQKMRAKFESEKSTGDWQLLKGNFVDKDGKPLYTVEKEGDEFRITLN